MNRIHLGFSPKQSMIRDQEGKCARCGRPFFCRTVIKWADTPTGEIKLTRFWGHAHLPMTAKALEEWHTYTLGDAEFHHIIPLSQDGSDTVANIQALCHNCHRTAHNEKANG